MERSHLLRSRRAQTTPALFLDRDGVVIEDAHYLSNPEDVQVLSGADQLLSLASERGWIVVMITNQSGISRGLFNWDAYDAVTERMLASLSGPEAIDAIYANGYGPEQGHQAWRKPNSGMIVQAAIDLNIDLRQSILVGDRLSDLKAGLNAELMKLVHVRTGHGEMERGEVLRIMESLSLADQGELPAIHVIDDLRQFPDNLLHSISRPS